MSHILVITTGGTIAMRPAAQNAGAAPQLTGQDFQLLFPKGETEVVNDLPPANS
jgi:L-asparaginase/Glu-tRNA(Gln) amidotransferase subunit D